MTSLRYRSVIGETDAHCRRPSSRGGHAVSEHMKAIRAYRASIGTRPARRVIGKMCTGADVIRDARNHVSHP